jgi:hypothetical protein
VEAEAEAVKPEATEATVEKSSRLMVVLVKPPVVVAQARVLEDLPA